MERRGSGASHSLRKALGHRAVAKRYVESLAPPVSNVQGEGRPRRASLEKETTATEQQEPAWSMEELKREDSSSSDTWNDENAQPEATAAESHDSDTSPATITPSDPPPLPPPSLPEEEIVRMEEMTVSAASLGREVLSTLYDIERLKESCGDGSSENSGEAKAVAPAEGEERSEADIIEEMLALDENALLADKILAHYYLGDKPGLKRYDSADAAMEREKQKRPHKNPAVAPKESDRGPSPEDSQSKIYATTEETAGLPAQFVRNPTSDCTLHEISLESPGPASPISTPPTSAYFMHSSIKDNANNEWGNLPSFISSAPKLERFDSADYYMHVYGKDNDMPSDPGTTALSPGKLPVPARRMDISPVPGQPFAHRSTVAPPPEDDTTNPLSNLKLPHYPLPTFQRFDSADYYLSKEKQKSRGAEGQDGEEGAEGEEACKASNPASKSSLGGDCQQPDGGDGFRASANFLIDPGAFRPRFSCS